MQILHFISMVSAVDVVDICGMKQMSFNAAAAAGELVNKFGKRQWHKIGCAMNKLR